MVPKIIYLVSLMLTTSLAMVVGKTIFLEPGETHEFTNKSSVEMNVYCYKGRPKYIIHLWYTVSLELDHQTENYVYYLGKNPTEVELEHKNQISTWTFNLFSWKIKRFKMDPFTQTCVGIESQDPYVVHLQVIRIDYWKIIMLLTGVVLFFYAKTLSGNQIFYYLCGISIGIAASFLVLIYLISKLFPKKPVMYGFVICGWTVGVYLIQMIWDNFRLLATVYNKYLLWYMLISGFISFIICYYWGPVTNPRTKNILKWILQGVALTMVYHSSHFQEASMGIIALILFIHNIPESWVSKSRTYWRRKFPPKTRLLSNDEYYQQGIVETAKALEHLREYCSSPNCKQWRTMLKLKDARRFASFVEGDSHLSDEEILSYEYDAGHPTELTEDEDITDDSSSNETYENHVDYL